MFNPILPGQPILGLSIKPAPIESDSIWLVEIGNYQGWMVIAVYRYKEDAVAEIKKQINMSKECGLPLSERFIDTGESVRYIYGDFESRATKHSII